MIIPIFIDLTTAFSPFLKINVIFSKNLGPTEAQQSTQVKGKIHIVLFS